MLSMSKPMKKGQAARYYKQDDYYLQEEGSWQGKIKEVLGLPDKVTKDDFNQLLDGKSPDGTELRSSKGETKRSAIDLTFSAPKSITLLGIENTSVIDAHKKAVENTIEYIQSGFIQTREQKNKQRTINTTNNLLTAKFDHITSRSLDPHLHTHGVIMNLTQKDSKEWRAMHNDRLYKSKIHLGRVYRSELANQMQELGYKIKITDQKQGFFEIDGVDQNIIDKFSGRRKQIESTVESLKKNKQYTNLSKGKLYEIAALGSRAEKIKKLDMETVKSLWDETINEFGISFTEMDSATPKQTFKQHEIKPIAEKAIEAITDQEVVFNADSFNDLCVRIGFGDRGINDYKYYFDNHQAGQNKSVLNLGKNEKANDGLKYYTTPTLSAKEHKLIQDINSLSNQKHHQVASQIETDLFMNEVESKQDYLFTKGQRQAIKTALTSKSGVNIIQGDAGTGKTSYLKPIKKMADRKNKKILGVGFTGKAAVELLAVGIQSMTIDSLVSRKIKFIDPKSKTEQLSKGQLGIEKGSMIVMDESSMTGLKQFSELMNVVKEGDLKLIIQGDQKQLPSINAGRIHNLILQKTTAPRVILDESVRQKKESLAKQNIDAFKAKGITGLLESLYDQGNAMTYTDWDIFNKKGMGDVVKKYMKLNEHGKTLLLTDKNEDKNLLNFKIREALKDKGTLKKGVTFLTWKPESLMSDKAMFSSSYKEGMKITLKKSIDSYEAGTVFTCIMTNDQDNTLALMDMDGKFFTLDLIKHSNHISAFTPTKLEFSKNDKVVFLKNDSIRKVKNGTTGIITNIDENNVATILTGKTSVKLNLSDEEPYKYIDHGYALTIHKGQGVTTDNCIYVHNSKENPLVSANAFYVAMTRSRDKTFIYSSNSDQLKEDIQKWKIKTSSLDFKQNQKERTQITERHL